MSDNDESQDNPASAASTPAPDSPPSDLSMPTPAPKPADPSPAERLTALEAEKADLKDRMLRIAAEFDNYKKRTRKEMSEHEAKARESVLREFLEIADNLERAVTSWKQGEQKDVKSVQDGVDLVLRLFKSKLERHSVTAIEAKGQPFDPRVHDAISQAPSADVPPGTVLHELQRGYRVGDRLLRPAMVVVSKAPPAPPVESSGADEKPAPTDGRAAGGVDIDMNGDDDGSGGKTS
ncbi:MAG: nucleotide exchange factor GrpE [Polyangia bacterium]